MDTRLGQLSRMLDTDHFVLVVHDQRQCEFKWLIKASEGMFTDCLKIEHVMNGLVTASAGLLIVRYSCSGDCSWLTEAYNTMQHRHMDTDRQTDIQTHTHMHTHTPDTHHTYTHTTHRHTHTHTHLQTHGTSVHAHSCSFFLVFYFSFHSHLCLSPLYPSPTPCFKKTNQRTNKKQQQQANRQIFHSQAVPVLHLHYYHHLSLNCKGCWGTTDDFATSFLHFPLFSTALWDLNSRPVHSLMLSSHLFLCLPCLLLPFAMPCKMVLARPDERVVFPPLSLSALSSSPLSLCLARWFWPDLMNPYCRSMYSADSGSKGTMENKHMIFGIATRIDLLNFIASHESTDEWHRLTSIFSTGLPVMVAPVISF